jgi:hypothetical protein
MEKNPVKPSGIEPATYQLVAQCLSQLRHQQRTATELFMLAIKHSSMLAHGRTTNRQQCLYTPNSMKDLPFLNHAVNL